MLPSGRTPAEHVALLLSISLRSIANAEIHTPAGSSSNKPLTTAFHPKSALNFPNGKKAPLDGSKNSPGRLKLASVIASKCLKSANSITTKSKSPSPENSPPLSGSLELRSKPSKTPSHRTKPKHSIFPFSKPRRFLGGFAKRNLPFSKNSRTSKEKHTDPSTALQSGMRTGLSRLQSSIDVLG